MEFRSALFFAVYFPRGLFSRKKGYIFIKINEEKWDSSTSITSPNDDFHLHLTANDMKYVIFMIIMNKHREIFCFTNLKGFKVENILDFRRYTIIFID